MGTRYAEGTTVSVENSRAEISSILTKHGVKNQGWWSGPEGDELMFDLGGHRFRFTMAKLTAKALRERDGKRYTYPGNINWEAKVESEWRRTWRANVLLLKAKLEFIASGDTTLERELMPYMLVDGNRTLGDVVAEGALPALLAAG